MTVYQAPDNHDRASWAAEAVAVFKARTMPGAGEDDVTAAADLVCDILHFVRLRCGVKDVATWAKHRVECHDEEVEMEL